MSLRKQIACHTESHNIYFSNLLSFSLQCNHTTPDQLAYTDFKHYIFCITIVVNTDGTDCSYIADEEILEKPMHKHKEQP